MPVLSILDDSATASLVFAIIGALAILLAACERLLSAAAEGHSRGRRYFIYFVVLSTLAVSVVTHMLQFYTVTTTAARERRDLETEIALSLWAYKSNEEVALTYLARNHKYLLGYHLFRANEPGAAQHALQSAIAKGSFVAPSHYILAVMARQAKDMKKVKLHIDAALTYDPGYSSAYLERGLMHALQSNPEAALNDIEEAVRLHEVHCYTVNRNAGTPSHPLYALKDEPRFQQVKDRCESIEKKLLRPT